MDRPDAPADAPVAPARKRRAVQQRGTRFTVTYFGSPGGPSSDSSPLSSSVSEEEESKEGSSAPVGDGEEAEARAPVVSPSRGDEGSVQSGDGPDRSRVPDVPEEGERLSRELKNILLSDKQVSGRSPTQETSGTYRLFEYARCDCPFYLDLNSSGVAFPCPVHSFFL